MDVQGPLETAPPAQASSPCLGLVSSVTLRELALCEISGPSQFWLSHCFESAGSPLSNGPKAFPPGVVWAQYTLQPGSLTGRSGAAPPTASSFLRMPLGPRTGAGGI